MAVSGLTAYLPEQTPKTGATEKEVRKLTSGEPVTVAEAQATGSKGPFDFLDGLTDRLGDAAGSILDAYTDKKVTDVRGNPETVNTTGDPMDQPGGGEVVAPPQPFMTKYKTPIMIGAGVVGLAIVAYMISKA